MRSVKAGVHYPLPDSPEELQAIADLPIAGAGPDSKDAVARYVQRARTHLSRKRWRNPKTLGLRAAMARQDMKEIARGRVEIQKEVRSVRELARVVRSTLLDTSREFDQAFGMIAQAFNQNEALPNGERVSVKELISAYKNFYNHIDKIGGPVTDDMREDAEEVVFQQAVEASRARITATLRDAITTTATTADAKNATTPTALLPARSVGGQVN